MYINKSVEMFCLHIGYFCVILRFLFVLCDCLFGIVVSTYDYHPRDPGFDSRLYSRNFLARIGSEAVSTHLMIIG